MMPMNMLVYRVTCFANAADVCMTMVGGRVLSFDEDAILERVNEVAELMIERGGLRHLLDEPTTLWGAVTIDPIGRCAGGGSRARVSSASSNATLPMVARRRTC